MVVTSVVSDSHTWNLVFLQLVLEELGHEVRNLGPCVSPARVVDECLRTQTDLVVVSTVNGHGFRDGRRLIDRIRSRPELLGLAVVIGGKLGISGGPVGEQARRRLRAAGFDRVYDDDDGADDLRSLCTDLLRVRRS